MAEPAIRRAITVLDTLSRDPETVRLAELRMKKLLDERSAIEGAKEEGKIESKIEDIIEILTDIGYVSEELKEKIYKQTDIELLKSWIKLAARCQGIEEFISKVKLN